MESGGKVVLGLLAGVAVGAVLGILMAPEKGSVTREKIMGKGDEFKDSLRKKFDDFMDSIKEKVNDMGDQVQSATHMK